MKPFIWNLLLGLVWVALTGDFSAFGYAVGLLLGYTVLSIAGSTVGAPGYGRWVWRFLGFLIFYLWELLLSNLRVAHDIIRLRSRMRPAIVAVPVDGLTDRQISLLANLITMTPGTLSIDVSSDASTLYVHAMFVDDPQALRDNIERTLTRRVRMVIQ